jgi:hypothetical protein
MNKIISLFTTTSFILLPFPKGEEKGKGRKYEGIWNIEFAY